MENPVKTSQLRKKHLIIITLIILAIILRKPIGFIVAGIVFFAYAALPHKAEYPTLSKGCGDYKVGAINDSKEALCAALKIDEVRHSIEKLESDSLFKGWNVKTDNVTCPGWSVTIRSVGFLPSYKCKVVFNKLEYVPEDKGSYKYQCGYNK